jgi:hypothetical protein
MATHDDIQGLTRGELRDLIRGAAADEEIDVLVRLMRDMSLPSELRLEAALAVLEIADGFAPSFDDAPIAEPDPDFFVAPSSDLVH